jgi:membrane protein DedA with SNARE-associated domain
MNMALPDVSHLIATWGYLGIVLVVVLGNVGLPMPEETVLAVAGYLVWSGRLQWLPVLMVGVVSAVAGDNVGYWLGRRYGRAAVERYARWLLKPRHVVAAERWLERYGAVGVGAARFVGGARFLAGPLAGALGLAFRSFFIGNLVGALLFVPYAVGIGYAVGYGLGIYVSRLHQTLGGAGAVILVVMVMGVVGLLGWRRGVRIVQRGIRMLSRLQCPLGPAPKN